MQLIDELINNPKKYNKLISSHNAFIPKDSKASALLAISFLYSGIALNIEYIYSIEKNTRTSFLKKCLYANRYSIGVLLKKGRESYEKELIADGLEPDSMATKNEIHHINSLIRFIPNTSQKSRNAKSYTHTSLGSCYMFKYENTQDTKGIIIDGVELAI